MDQSSKNAWFIAKARGIHGDRFDYSKVEYKNNNTRVTIICPVHGEFSQSGRSHVNMERGCSQCSSHKHAKNRAMTTEDFVASAKAIHGDFYDYSQVNYVTSKQKVTIICKEHGPFQQMPSEHLRNKGCKHHRKSRTSKAQAAPHD